MEVELHQLHASKELSFKVSPKPLGLEGSFGSLLTLYSVQVVLKPPTLVNEGEAFHFGQKTAI